MDTTSPTAVGDRIKLQYPVYKDIPSELLGAKILSKFPSLGTPTPTSNTTWTPGTSPVYTPPANSKTPYSPSGTNGTGGQATTKQVSREDLIAQAKAAGYSDAEINAYLSTQGMKGIQAAGQSPESQVRGGKTAGGFLNNVWSSGVQNAKDIGGALINVFNPDMEKNTVANLGRLAVGTAELFIPGKQKLEERPKAVAEFYKNRYGSWDKAKESIYKDPVGVALDLSVVMSGGSSILNKIGKVGKAEQAANIAKNIDPLVQTGRQLPKITKQIGKGKQALVERTALKSTKITPTRQLKFEKIAGVKIGKYMADHKLYALEDVTKAKTGLQQIYNDFVRTGKEVDKSLFISNIRKQAEALLARDKSATARATAAKMLDEAEYFTTQGNLTDTLITNTKSGYWGGVPESKIVDPTVLNFNKEMGKVGLKTLDEIAPGSARIGKQLQALNYLEDAMARGGNVGKSTNNFNILKPAGAGAAAGYAVGGAPGAAIGGLTTGIIDAPIGQRFISKVLNRSVPEGVKAGAGKIAEKSYQAGKLSSRVLPNVNQSIESKFQQPTLPTDQQTSDQSYTNDTSPTTQNQPVSYRTGASPEEWNLQIQKEMAQPVPNEKTIKFYEDQRDIEIKNQDKIAKGDSSGSQAKVAINILSQLQGLYGQVQQQGLTASDPGLYNRASGYVRGNWAALRQSSPEAATYTKTRKAFLSLITRGLGERGVLTNQDINRVKEALPNYDDTPEVAAKSWGVIMGILEEASKKEQNMLYVLPDISVVQ